MENNKSTLENTSKSTGNDWKSLDSIDRFTAVIFTVISVFALLVVRGALFYHEWGDYSFYFQPWIARYRTMTFIEGLGTYVGNYNPPYMYILNLVARININELYVLKTVHVLFDFLIAYFIMKIVSLRTDSANMRILAFVLTLAIPTVILNSSMWAQCDSIYASFAIGSIYFGLQRRGKPAYVFMALAVSFKLQAAFLLPMFAVFVFMKKTIAFKDCYIFFLVYIATLLPAILAGMPIADVFSIYINQVGLFSSLNMNIVNIWRFVGNVSYDNFMTAGLYMAGLAVLGLMYFTYVNRERLVNTVDYVRLSYLFAVIMPFLLPKMHDRYYFMADVLSLAVFLFDKRRWYVPVVTVFCSYLGYAYFLMFGAEIVDYRLAALALLAVIIIVLRDYVMSLYPVQRTFDIDNR
jgi:Gpi18-like mannosyltransferase